MGMLLRRHAEQREAKAAAELEAARVENERAAAEDRRLAEEAKALEAAPAVVSPESPKQQGKQHRK